MFKYKLVGPVLLFVDVHGSTCKLDQDEAMSNLSETSFQIHLLSDKGNMCYVGIWYKFFFFRVHEHTKPRHLTC